MLKRLLSVTLAVVMTAAFMGCTQSSGVDQQGNNNMTKVSYINQAGKTAPISMHTTDESVSSAAEYSALYTGVNNSFAATMANTVDPGMTGVFSPLSLQIALQVLALGGDETTEKELLDSVCPGLTRDDVNASSAKLISILSSTEGFGMSSAVVANSAYRVCEEFANAAANYYRASVGVLDFTDADKATVEINKWISDNTDGLVNELIDHLGADTAMVILNALTLKLEWEKPFTAMRGLTEFHGLNGSEFVAMINNTASYEYGSFEDGEIVVVPYKGGEYNMAVILPAEGVSPADAAASLMGRFSECTPANVFLKMPKVELSTKLDVIPMAEKLGIDSGINGQFTRLIDGDGATVSRILQGATLSVTEYGTTASAATAIVATKGAPMVAEHEVVCDRPYAMVIYHAETGAVLFVSTVNDVG